MILLVAKRVQKPAKNVQKHVKCKHLCITLKVLYSTLMINAYAMGVGIYHFLKRNSLFLSFLKYRKMKKLSIIILLVIGFIGQNLFAQTVDSKGRVIDSKGDVYIDGTKLGSVTMDSIVKNANGKPMAFLKPGGVLVNSKGRTLGRMGKDGKTYYNANGTVVYKIKENTDSETCQILDANGKVIGDVHQNYKAMACTLHCFSNGMDAKTHKKIKK